MFTSPRKNFETNYSGFRIVWDLSARFWNGSVPDVVLDNFVAGKKALVCVSDCYKLYDEALSIYVKFSTVEFTKDDNERQFGVLVEKLNDFNRAKAFAALCLAWINMIVD
jgi:hypothetical protein